MIKSTKVAIIGAGAAGLFSSIIAKKNGAEVLLFEQLDRVGKKILATGNGRCNITNANIKIDRFHGENPEFASYALNEFNSDNVMNFFYDLGVLCKEEEGGKVYPYSDQASSVLDVLRYEVSRLGIEEKVNTRVKKIENKKGKFRIYTEEECFNVDRVIIATGGRSAANLGSTGTGYDIAKSLGHKMISTFPALVQLKLDYSNLKAMKGVKFIGEASVIVGGREVKSEEGEILFTDYGISGPPILQLSREAILAYENNSDVYIKVDMFNEITYKDLYDILEDRFLRGKEKNLDFALVGLINKKLIPTVLKHSKIDNIKKECKDLSKSEINSICTTLKSWKFKVSGSNGWKFSQVTAGGISTNEVNSNTMESKKVKGLYFAGEILDIDGDCGGFNLQWAWSSAYIAAINSIK